MGSQALIIYEKDEETKEKYKEDIAKVHNNIGIVHFDKGDNDEALKEYKKALKLQKEIYGVNHESIARTLSNIGSCHLDKKEYDAAYENLEKALKMMEELYGKDNDHKLLATIYHNLGRNFMECDTKRDLNKALDYANKSFEMYKRLYADETHPDVVESKELIEEIE